MTARIIILNGPSSVGKSTLVAELRPLLPDTFCYYASDQLADEGFRPTAPTPRLHGREAFFDGFHRSIAAFASAGLDLLVEHIVEKPVWRADLDRFLLPFDVFWVGLFAPIEEVERRECMRGDRTIGEAREHFATHTITVPMMFLSTRHSPRTLPPYKLRKLGSLERHCRTRTVPKAELSGDRLSAHQRLSCYTALVGVSDVKGTAGHVSVLTHNYRLRYDVSEEPLRTRGRPLP